MQCPRCSKKMCVAKVRPTGVQATVAVDWCDQCGGMWLDKGEAEAVCPTFAMLEKRHIEITALGSQGTGISACPRCNAAPYEFRILDLLIDYCGSCSGVWLDAAEHEGRTRGHDAEQASVGPYRAIQQAATTGETACVGCASTAPLSDMHMTANGLACRQCYASAMSRAANVKLTRDAESPLVSRIIGSLRELALATAEVQREHQFLSYDHHDY